MIIKAAKAAGKRLYTVDKKGTERKKDRKNQNFDVLDSGLGQTGDDGTDCIHTDGNT